MEVLGAYDPRTDVCTVNGERAKHWLSKGAKATPTIHNLLITTKVISGTKINVLPQKKIVKAEEPAAEATPAAPTSVPATETKATEADTASEENVEDKAATQPVAAAAE